MGKINESQNATFLKALGPDAYQVPDKNEQLPEGYHLWTSPTGAVYARPGGAISIPPEMVALFPGSKPGDLKTRKEYDTALQQYRGQQNALALEAAKAGDRDTSKQITPEQRVAAIAAGVDPADPTKWTKEEAAAVNKEIAKQKQAIHFTVNQGAVNPNAEPGNMAHMVSDYQIPMREAISRMPPAQREDFARQVHQLNPEYQESNFDTYKTTERDATTGRIATSATDLNTMIGHLTVLDQAATALKNNDIQALNKIANFFSVQTGNTPVTTYQAIVHRLGPEITKAYVAGGGTQGERGTNEEDFRADMGPDQIKQNIGISALLADSKIKAIQDQYQRGTYSRGKQKLISDEAEAARQNLAARTSGYVKTATGPDGHKIGKKADGLWYDTKTGARIK